MNIHYITENKALEALASALDNKDEIAIDLEFDRNRYRYGFNLCLMQIYDGSECHLVDPLSADLNIEIIFSPIENPKVQKVVFAFGEDLRLLHSMGCFPKNLYDLDAATSLLNFEPASLTNLIKDVMDIEVNSSSQQSNWYKRPLSKNQKQYAADDVIYLLDFKNELNRRASEKGILKWIKQENSLFDKLDYSNEDHVNVIKDKDKNDLTMFEWHVYSALMEFFDQVAEKHNMPVYQIINKNKVAELARNPEKAKQWEQTKRIYGRIKNARFKARLQSELDKAIHEANQNNLSKSRLASKNLSQDEYRAMRDEQQRINHEKSVLFDPIQDRLEEDYGRHAKAFILPNRLTKEIISGETELLPDYKIELFRKYANDLNLDLSKYL